MFLRCLQVTSQTLTEPPSKSFYKTLFGVSHWCHRELSVDWLAPSNEAENRCPFQFVRVCSSPLGLDSASARFPANFLSRFSFTFPLEIHPPRQSSIQLQITLSVECPLSCALRTMVQVGVHRLRRSCRGRHEKVQSV